MSPFEAVLFDKRPEGVMGRQADGVPGLLHPQSERSHGPDIAQRAHGYQRDVHPVYPFRPRAEHSMDRRTEASPCGEPASGARSRPVNGSLCSGRQT